MVTCYRSNSVAVSAIPAVEGDRARKTIMADSVVVFLSAPVVLRNWEEVEGVQLEAGKTRARMTCGRRRQSRGVLGALQMTVTFVPEHGDGMASAATQNQNSAKSCLRGRRR
jgi:hypothetical protein